MVRKLTQQMSNGKVYGIDYSATMLDIASECNRQAIKDGQVQLIIGNAEKMVFSEALFDMVIAVHVVYFCPDLSKVIREIHRVMKNGGIFALYFVYPILFPNKHFIPYSSEAISKELVACGFKEVREYRNFFGKQQGICLIVRK